MHVFWLEQAEAGAPAENDWLSSSEAVCLTRMGFAKRRKDWRLGRWTAKCAVAALLKVPVQERRELAAIEIRATASGAPEVFFAGKPAPAISLSHREGIALCAVASPVATLGCDLEVTEPRSDAFIADFFTTEEQAMIARASPADRSTLVTLLWSGKESALKVLGAGLRLDTRCVTVSPGDSLEGQDENGEGYLPEEFPSAPSFPVRNLPATDTWRPMRIRHIDGHVFHGWWRYNSKLVRTIVASPPPGPPIPLNIPPWFLSRASTDGSEQTPRAFGLPLGTKISLGVM